jgi:hypothetical protein
VFICGAKRSNHGPYQIHLDGLASSFDGFSAEAILQQPLYTSPVLEQGQHTVTLINYSDDPNRPFLDLDFVRLCSHPSPSLLHLSDACTLSHRN